MYFGYCCGGGKYIYYVETIVESGPGSPSDRTLIVVVGDCRRTGGGLLRWQVELVSWACILRESRRFFQYEIKPLCHSVQIYQYIPGIDVIVRVIAV